LTINNYIRRFLAAFFLLLFAFCVTPKRFLHDLMANHKDAQTGTRLPFAQVASSGYHCHTDDLVVVAPFLPGIQTAEPLILSSAQIQFSEPLYAFRHNHQPPSDGRGPPADFCS
jgi:hypothetical protein